MAGLHNRITFSWMNLSFKLLYVGFQSINKITFFVEVSLVGVTGSRWAYLAFLSAFSVCGRWKSPKQSCRWSAPPAPRGSGWWWNSEPPVSLGQRSTLDRCQLYPKVQVVEAEKVVFQQHDVAFGLTWFQIHNGGLLWHGGIGNRDFGLFFWRWSWWVISTVWTVTYWTEPDNEKKTKNKKNHNIRQLQAAALTGV